MFTLPQTRGLPTLRIRECLCWGSGDQAVKTPDRWIYAGLRAQLPAKFDQVARMPGDLSVPIRQSNLERRLPGVSERTSADGLNTTALQASDHDTGQTIAEQVALVSLTFVKWISVGKEVSLPRPRFSPPAVANSEKTTELRFATLQPTDCPLHYLGVGHCSTPHPRHRLVQS